MTMQRRDHATIVGAFPASAKAGAASGPRALRALVAAMLGVALVSGCSGSSGGGGVTQTMGGWFGGSSSKESAKVLYARKDGVEVRAKDDASSKPVSRLGAGEKVVRTRTSGKWAYIEARGGRVKGWVPSSALASRPPSAAGAATPAGSGATSETDAAEQAGGEAADQADAESEAEAQDVDEAGTDEADQATEAAADSPTAGVADDEAPAAPQKPTAPEPAAPKARPARKGSVAPSVFDPY